MFSLQSAAHSYRFYQQRSLMTRPTTDASEPRGVVAAPSEGLEVPGGHGGPGSFHAAPV